MVMRALEMVGMRMCSACYAGEVHYDNRREDKADLRGRYVTFEESI